MTNYIDVLIRIVFSAILGILIYYVVPAVKIWRESKLSQSQRDEMDYWVEIGVRWAKQWMQSSTGEEKKEVVTAYVLKKVADLGLPYTQEDIDKAIEAVYECVKGEIAATGAMVVGSGGVTSDTVS